MCRNRRCPKKNFNRILNWISVAEIEDFGEALVVALQDVGKLDRMKDIYKLHKEDIASLEGWGAKSAETIIQNIKKSASMSAIRFLTAMGIPGISKRTAEDLLKNFRSVQRLQVATEEEIKGIRGFSDISAAAIVSGIAEYWADVSEMMDIISITSIGDEANMLPGGSKGSLSGTSFCFTGSMSKPRNIYQRMVEEKGGVNSTSVVKNLTYLVCNENKGSSKSKKAQEYGVKVITEEEFLSLAGESPETKPVNTAKVIPLF
jgi:DNA ligase (NAD+)